MATASNYSAIKSPKDAETPGKHHHDTAVEFVVHTKHTCDECFQRPILGQRYTSSIKSNFDLCADCFEKYTGPEIGLTEAVLVRDIKASLDFVLKLKIVNGGEVQVRRMKVAEIWDKSSSILSYAKVLSIAASFAVLPYETFAGYATASYIDEDGDEVNISSDNELKDAFLQIIAMLPVRKPFLITVTAPKAQVMTDNKATGMPKRIQLKKAEPAIKKVFSVSMSKSPMVGTTGTNVLRITPKDFENQLFVHARHTCDGCSKCPIIGTRYHATKIPDFDLCTSCFKEYEGDDLDFTPEIQGRDLRMQPKWLKNLGTSDIPSKNAEPTDLTRKIPNSEKANSLGITNESLSDADAHESITNVIGHTLNDCVAAIEELQKTDEDNAVKTAIAAADSTVVSSTVLGADEMSTKAEDAKSNDLDTALSVATEENVLKSDDCNEYENGSKMPTVEDASTSEEDGWSVVSNED